MAEQARYDGTKESKYISVYSMQRSLHSSMPEARKHAPDAPERESPPVVSWLAGWERKRSFSRGDS
jgi:hypothetical protein